MVPMVPMVPKVILDALPREVAATFAGLWPRVQPQPDGLRRAISQHCAEVERAAGKNEFLDTSLSRSLATVFETVLADWAELDTVQQAAVAAAVAYFALNEDAEDDLDSVLGFEDDALVFNACARFIGRADLSIDIE